MNAFYPPPAVSCVVTCLDGFPAEYVRVSAVPIGHQTCTYMNDKKRVVNIRIRHERM